MSLTVSGCRSWMSTLWIWMSAFRMQVFNILFSYFWVEWLAGYQNWFNANSMIQPWWLPRSCLIGTLHERRGTGNCREGILDQATYVNWISTKFLVAFFKWISTWAWTGGTQTPGHHTPPDRNTHVNQRKHCYTICDQKIGDTTWQ